MLLQDERPGVRLCVGAGHQQEDVAAARRSLQPQGHLIFTVELAGEEHAAPYTLHPSGRFRHQRSYVEHCLQAAGLEVLLVREESLRVEMQQAVPGLVVLARG